MTKLILCLALAALTNGCAISVSSGSGPAAPGAVAYLPPPTAHPAPTPAPQTAPPAAEPASPPGRQPAVARADQPAPAATETRRTPAPREAKKNKKLHKKDIWGAQNQPNSAPKVATPAARLARTP